MKNLLKEKMANGQKCAGTFFVMCYVGLDL